MIPTFGGVRIPTAAGFLLLTVATSNAQEQEKKLLDRLLKPETSLQNPAQNQQFIARGGVLTKNVRSKPFYVSQRAWEKRYPGTKEFETKEFVARQSPFANKTANTSSRSRLTKIDAPYSTAAYATRNAADNQKAAPTSGYSGVRPFLLQGKSQKSLSAHDTPLTLEQVRELLNKNE